MSKQHAWAGAIAVAIVLAGSFVTAQGRITAAATGSGQVTINGLMRTFGFTVNRDASGNAKGQLEVVNRDQGLRLHGVLNCLNLVGNTAIISGQVTDTNTPAWENAYLYLKVVDNGEGGNAPPDKISLVYSVIPGLTCDIDAFVPFMDVEKGNVQIRP